MIRTHQFTLLFSFVALTSTIYTSETGDKAPEAVAQSASVITDKALEVPTPTSPQEQSGPGGSTLFTNLYYGTRRVLGGESATSIFLKKVEDEQVQGDLKNDNIAGAISDYQLAITHQYTKEDKNRITKRTQERIKAIFDAKTKAIKETNVEFTLAEALINKYRTLQAKDLENLIAQHAKEDQPKYEQECITKKHAADIEYQERMAELLSHALLTANNYKAIDRQCQESQKIDTAKKENFTDIKAYETYLKSQSNVPSK